MDLLNYIHQARKSGMGDEQIRQGLLQAGWPANDVNEALMNVPVTVVPRPKPRAMMSKSLAIIFIVTTLAIGGYFAGAYYVSNYQDLPLWPFDVSVPIPMVTPSPTVTACTQEAKLCPDGSAVGRTGPNCEFAPCPGEVDTSTWKTYRNETNSFEFKYPINWIYDKTTSSDFVLDFKPQGYGYQLGVFNLDLACVFSDKNDYYQKDGAGYYSSLKEFDYLPADWPKCEKIGFWLIDPTYRDIFNQIFSTFKFIDATDTLTWKTYRNDEYGFEFKYPGDWKVDECSKDRIYFNGHCDTDTPYGGSIQINPGIFEINPNSVYTIFDVGGIKAKKYETETNSAGPGNQSGLNSWFIIFSRNDKNIVDVFVLDLAEQFDGDFPIYDQILSTFKFTR